MVGNACSYWIYPPASTIFRSSPDLLWDDVQSRCQPPSSHGVVYVMFVVLVVCRMLNCCVVFWRPLFLLCGRWVEDVCLMAFKHRPGKRIEGGLYTKAGVFFSLKDDEDISFETLVMYIECRKEEKEEANVFP
ncbi:hypothetical protein HDV64DRAFT_35517 [Trichoderma sp. TUCIM 5745]